MIELYATSRGSGAMADIFCSYKREDREKIAPLVEALQAHGWSVWWDNRIGAGETWDQVIEAELKAAKCILVAWTKRSIESDWVRAEAHEGRERKCLIPIILEGVTPPSIFKMIQATDLSHWRGAQNDPSLLHVFAGITRLLGQAGTPKPASITLVQQPPDEKQKPRWPIERHWAGILLAGAAIALALLIVVWTGMLAWLMTPSSEGTTPRPQQPRARSFQIAEDNLPPAAAAASPTRVTSADHDRRIEYNTSLIRSEPRNASAYIDRGIAYAKKGEFNKAVPDFNKAIEIDPNSAPAYNNRGLAYRRKDDLKKALSDYAKAIQIDPRYAEAYNNRGYALCHDEEYDRAFADFAKAVAIDPKYAEAFRGRAACHHANGNYDAAIADYTRAIDLDPSSARAHNGRGVVYYDRASTRTKSQEDYDRAISDYDKAIELNPAFAVAYKNRGLSYRVRNELDRAIADYSKAIEFNSKFSEAYTFRGYAHQLRGKTEDRAQALADYTKALKIDPNNELAKKNLSDLRGKR